MVQRSRAAVEGLMAAMALWILVAFTTAEAAVSCQNRSTERLVT